MDFFRTFFYLIFLENISNNMNLEPQVLRHNSVMIVVTVPVVKRSCNLQQRAYHVKRCRDLHGEPWAGYRCHENQLQMEKSLAVRGDRNFWNSKSGWTESECQKKRNDRIIANENCPSRNIKIYSPERIVLR